MSISTIVQYDFASLISTASENRPDNVDSTFIRVDLWGNKFNNLRFRNYETTADAKRYRKAVSERFRLKVSDLISKPKRGAGGGTGTLAF
jgi:hypothetical protein